MSDHIALDANPRPEPSRRDASGVRSGTRETVDIWIGCALLVLTAGLVVLLRSIIAMNPDTSWLITVSEQLLAGKKLYVDVAETNPPASVWLYLPIVALARVLHVSPEAAITAYIFAILFFSVGLAGVILSRAGGLRHYNVFLLAPLVVLLFAVVPGDVFSQREHIAVMLCLPFLAVTWARANGAALSWPVLIAAGICGGAVAIIKPYFVLTLELPVLIALVARPRWQTLLSPENVVAGFLAAIYVLAAFVFYPEYWTVTMKANVLLYLPVAEHWRAFTSNATLILLVALLVSWLHCGSAFQRHPTLMLLAAAVGFWVAFIVQGKMWLNHVYPVIVLVILGGVMAVFDRSLGSSAERRGEVRPVANHWLLSRLLHPVVISIIALAYFVPMAFTHFDMRRLVAAITRLHPNPVIAIVSGDLTLGHPVTRMVNGRWGMTQPSLWIPSNGELLRQNPAFDRGNLPAIEAIENADLRQLLADLRRNKPDILLQYEEEKSLRDRVHAFQGMAQELDRYDVVDAFPVAQDRYTINILRRRPDPRTPDTPPDRPD